MVETGSSSSFSSSLPASSLPSSSVTPSSSRTSSSSVSRSVKSLLSLAVSSTDVGSVESKREWTTKLNCLSIQRQGKLRTYIRKREKEKLHADRQSQSPKPNISAEATVGLLLSMGAGKADGGQTRLVGVGEDNGCGKPPASCPSPPASTTKEATGPNSLSTDQYPRKHLLVYWLDGILDCDLAPVELILCFVRDWNTWWHSRRSSIYALRTTISAMAMKCALSFCF